MSTPWPRECLEQMSFVKTLCAGHPSQRSTVVNRLVHDIEHGWLCEGFPDWDPTRAARDYLDLDLPADENNHHQYCVDRLVSETLKKSTWLPTGIDTEQAARSAFYESEAHCKETNARLFAGDRPSWFDRVRENIAEVLGPLDKTALQEIEWLMKHGPGASVGVQGMGSVGSDKYRYPATFTKALWPFLNSILPPILGVRKKMERKAVPGSEWTSVNKDATKKRGIAKEPTWNLYGQLGIGEYMLLMLLVVGIDLRDQSKNQYLAMMAYEWLLATIDLRQASDSTAYELVRLLFPEPWFRLLALFRSPMILIDEKWIKLEKWSTMGNGYTFPLESLIFYAVVRAMVPREDMPVTAVYGDDIIVPQEHAAAVIEALEYLGYRVNKKKSFLAGDFFESCGQDFLKGKPCRPFHLHIEDDPDEVPIPMPVHMANGLRRWSKDNLGYCDMNLKPLWAKMVQASPRMWRNTCVSPHMGDTGIIREVPLGKWRVTNPEKEGYGWEGVRGSAVSFILEEDEENPARGALADRQDEALMISKLRGLERRERREPWWINPREFFDAELRHKRGKPRLPGKGDIADGHLPPGREARRGIHGRPVARIVHVSKWTEGWDWA